jgi:hypothetical protein
MGANTNIVDPRRRRQLILLLLIVPIGFLAAVKLHYYLNPLHIDYIYNNYIELNDKNGGLAGDLGTYNIIILLGLVYYK